MFAGAKRLIGSRVCWRQDALNQKKLNAEAKLVSNYHLVLFVVFLYLRRLVVSKTKITTVVYLFVICLGWKQRTLAAERANTEVCWCGVFTCTGNDCWLMG